MEGHLCDTCSGFYQEVASPIDDYDSDSITIVAIDLALDHIAIKSLGDLAHDWVLAGGGEPTYFISLHSLAGESTPCIDEGFISLFHFHGKAERDDCPALLQDCVFWCNEVVGSRSCRCFLGEFCSLMQFLEFYFHIYFNL